MHLMFRRHLAIEMICDHKVVKEKFGTVAKCVFLEHFQNALYIDIFHRHL